MDLEEGRPKTSKELLEETKRWLAAGAPTDLPTPTAIPSEDIDAILGGRPPEPPPSEDAPASRPRRVADSVLEDVSPTRASEQRASGSPMVEPLRRRSRAANAAVFIVLVAVGIFLAARFADTGDDSTTTPPVTGSAVLEPGTCLSLPTDAITEAVVVPCDEVHEYEVMGFVAADLTPDAAFQACFDGFETYTGVAWEDSPYWLDVRPVPDDGYVCLLYFGDQEANLIPATGTARG